MEKLKRLYETRINRARAEKKAILATARARATLAKCKFTIIKFTHRELDYYTYYSELEQESRDKLAKIA